jgi:hypothetical protein
MAESRGRWFKDRHRELRVLVWAWDPLRLEGAPDDEYGFIVDAVLGELVRGADDGRLAERVATELGEALGASHQPLDSAQFVAAVRRWFQDTPPRPE